MIVPAWRCSRLVYKPDNDHVVHALDCGDADEDQHDHRKSEDDHDHGHDVAMFARRFQKKTNFFFFTKQAGLTHHASVLRLV